jgi:hypothetical protein
VFRDELLVRGRAAAEDRMVDACTIRRRTGETTDPNTGEITPTYDVLYQGQCRVQQQAMQAQQQDAGEAYLLMVRLEVHLPITVTGLEPDDEVQITASSTDPDLPGRTFYIRDLAHASDKTARRVGTVERTS